MSPEQADDKKYNEKSDIWSTGCIVYELATLKRPFESNSQLALAEKIRKGKFERLPIAYSENLQNLIRGMLNVNPQKRLSTQEILEIPIIKVRLEGNSIREEYELLASK